MHSKYITPDFVNQTPQFKGKNYNFFIPKNYVILIISPAVHPQKIYVLKIVLSRNKYQFIFNDKPAKLFLLNLDVYTKNI